MVQALYQEGFGACSFTQACEAKRIGLVLVQVNRGKVNLPQGN